MKRLINTLCIFCLLHSALGQTKKLDIPYVPNGKHKQQLDLYTPNATDFPIILFVHGGSLTSGDRKDEPFAKMCQVFQSQGIACVVMSYRLAPENKWPNQPDDVVAAFDWIKKNIAEYGGDTDKIYLFGHSSGCLLVSMVGTDASYLAKNGYTQKDIAGVIPMGCRLQDEILVTKTKPENYEKYYVHPKNLDKFDQTDLADVFQSMEQLNNAVPVKHITAELPRTLILLAEHERFYPPILREAAEFVGRALEMNADADLKIFEGRTHMSAINNMTTVDDEVVQTVLEFIRKE